MKSLVLATLVSAFTTQVLPATVVSGTNIALAGSGPQYALAIYQDSAATDITEIIFTVSGSQLSFDFANLDSGSDWYLVSNLDTFTNATIEADTFQTFARIENLVYESFVIDPGFGPFYLGVATTHTDTMYTGDPPRDVFGWVQLTNAGGNLSIGANAVAYEESGIIIGTTDTIPEPSTLLLVLPATLYALGKHRRR
ncbi:PEP-CTERM protein-sorting domain-containing protein [Rubritalea squalenifaciens DSM 18772]|uniref:PEP-CTERM protein-sorting domain-containing protein n=1 Tax=Rubritalea squalenifaciens DSM 18772 TaxID=1123071 RepID=A0A1M6QM10_9BACT|nr:hypothetical protein [Rubritalea squalenifaciens]SHK21281.1 PEP-CTERM protein-sorting domain-containing protein [Rubritalea squalenifaciens DSM 18772]